MMMFALIGWGIYNTTTLPIDAVPDITNNQVLVITPSPTLGAADIERLITFPIEIATRNIPGIIEQRSFSRFGLSIITIVFSDKTDVYWARQQVTERLNAIKDQIPPGMGTPSLGPVTTGLGEIFQYVVRPMPGYEGKYSPMELRTIQDWIVRRQLLGTPGIADVSSFGGKLKQYEIAVNPDRMKSYGLTITDIFDALGKNNQNTGGGYIEKGPAVLFIKSEGLVTSNADIENIAVKYLGDGTPVLIRDVATVQTGFATRYGAMCYNDKGEVAGAVVMMLKGGNSSKVIKAVKSKIEEIQKTLPPGVVIEAFLDRTKMVNNAISTVKKNLIEGALIVVFILVLFLGNLRAGLLVASVIPLAMLFAISMMNLFGVSGNLMSLGALDFGLIIDGAVIIVEATMHHLHHQNKQGTITISQDQMDTEVKASASKMMNAAVFGQVIILIVYFPILSLEGIEGKMFKPMAETVVFAIVGAFILSLTYVPMMSALLLSKKISNRKNLSDRMMARLENVYQRVLRRTLGIPKTVLFLALGLLGIAVYILLQLGGEFIPKLEEGDFAVDTRILTGSSLTTTIAATQQTAHILLQKFPEVQKVVTKIGSGEIPTDPMPMDASDMMVILNPKKQWTSAKTFDELAEKMSVALEDIAGVTTGFQFPVQMRFNELMTGGRQDVICKLFGENLDTLAIFAAKIGGLIHGIDGARDIYVESQTGLPQIVINYNRKTMAEFGISVREINNIVQSAFAGAVTGQVFENERRFDLVVRLNGPDRKTLEDVQQLLVPVRNGTQVPLQQLADVKIQVGPSQIQRENAQRRITVGFNVRGKDVQTVVKELQAKIASSLKLPPAYYLTYGGQFENLVAAKKRLSIAVPISLLLIFLMLYFAFTSFGESFLIFTAIPLSAIGGIFGLFIRGMPFSISAGVGFIALFGISVLNGIVLLTEFNQLLAAGVTDIGDRIRQGTGKRLRPVLMTATVASLGFLPMAMSNGSGAEVQRPLATVVIGGLISATLLTLIVLPILYGVFYRWKNKRGDKQKSRETQTAKVVAVLGLILLTGLPGVYGQGQPISLKAAVDTALLHNRTLQSARLQTRVLRELEAGSWEIPLTSLQGEYGQINSYQKDTRFTILQSTAFPVVYKRQQSLYQAETRAGGQHEDVIRLSIKKQVMLLYAELVSLTQKMALLQRADSLYRNFLDRQELRFKAGDANIVEKTAAETQHLQALNQLRQAMADYAILQQQFSYLLASRTVFVPADNELLLDLRQYPDSAAVSKLPVIRYKNAQEEIVRRELQLAKAKKLPLVSAGYTNQSFNGFQKIGNNDVYYDGSRRFSSVAAGINFPIFSRTLNARIKAGRARVAAVASELADSIAYQDMLLSQGRTRYQKNQQTLSFYREALLKQATVLYQNATLQFNNGAISFLEWSLLVNQAIGLEAGYTDALLEYNKSVIDLNAYSPDF